MEDWAVRADVLKENFLEWDYSKSCKFKHHAALFRSVDPENMTPDQQKAVANAQREVGAEES